MAGPASAPGGTTTEQQLDAGELGRANCDTCVETLGGPVTVWDVDQADCPPYREFVDSHPAATVYHSLAWRDMLVRAGVGTPRYLLALRGDEATGVLPLFEVERGGRRVLVSLPETPIGGCVAADAETFWLLASRAEQLAEQRGATGVLVARFGPAAAGVNVGAATGWVQAPACALLAAGGSDGLVAAGWQVSVAPLEAGHEALFHSAPQRHLIAGLLRQPFRNCRPMLGLLRDGRGRDVAAALWLQGGLTIHVLALARPRASSVARRAILAKVAHRQADLANGKIVYPVRREGGEEPAYVSETPAVRVSRETPLILNSALQAANTGPALGL